MNNSIFGEISDLIDDDHQKMFFINSFNNISKSESSLSNFSKVDILENFFLESK